MNRGIPLILAVLAAAPLSRAQSAAVDEKISGRIVSAATGRPIPGARANANVADYGLGAAADADGRFEITAREPGQYRVYASAPGYVNGSFGDEPELGLTLVAVKAGAHVTGIDMALHHGATVAGVVTDDGNEPFVAGSVRAFAARVQYGMARWISVGEVKTDDRGRYRLTGLPAGQYAIGAIDRTAITFAPSAAAPAAATIKVAGDETRENVNIRLRALKSGAIESTVTGPGMFSPSMTVQLLPDPIVAMLPTITSRAQAGGRVSFTDVPAGRYHLIVRPGSNGNEPRGWSIAPVTVAAGATAEATLALNSGPRLSGTIQTTGVRSLSLRLAPIGDDRPEASPQQLQVLPQGPFVFPTVPPGRYKFDAPIGQGDPLPQSRIARIEEPATHRLISSITIKGEDVSDRLLVVSPGVSIEDVKVTVTETASRISGTVLDANGRPATRGAVVVAPVDPRDWTLVSRRIRLTRADTDGVFHVPTLPPGRYRVAHIDGLKPGQLWDPAFLRSLAGAREVDLSAGQVLSVELRLK